ncbi:MAG TPA: glucokinase [Gemmatimonadaceae bacterium]|nr:glucokinase [Gemmatimonadaceae bacterium]
MKVLAGDVGGTHARLAAVDVDGTTVRVGRFREYESRAFPAIAPIVVDFISRGDESFERATFGVACPVTDGDCVTPNLPWKVSARTIASETGIAATSVINDLHAMAYGVTRMRSADLVPLQEAEPVPDGVIALIGAGTGLGQAYLAWDGSRYRAFASEGGHATFAPRTTQEWELRNAIASEHGHVSYERVVSGQGIENIYRFLVSVEGAREDPAVAAAVRAEGAVAISRSGLDGSDPICVEALKMFAAAYGSQAGNLALHVLATGGVYLVGGIAKAMAARLRGDGIFMTAFRDKGRMGELLSRIPVNVVVNAHIGLVGAAVAACEDAPENDDSGAGAPNEKRILGAS